MTPTCALQVELGGLPQQLALNSHIIYYISYYILVFTQNLTERETFGSFVDKERS